MLHALVHLKQYPARALDVRTLEILQGELLDEEQRLMELIGILREADESDEVIATFEKDLADVHWGLKEVEDGFPKQS